MQGKTAVRDPHPVASTECQFGKWFHSDGEKLFELLESDEMERVNLLHNKLHQRYLEIYEIYFGSADGIVRNPGALLEKQKVTRTMEQTAHKHFDDLRSLSRSLLDELSRLQKMIRDSDKFD